MNQQNWVSYFSFGYIFNEQNSGSVLNVKAESLEKCVQTNFHSKSNANLGEAPLHRTQAYCRIKGFTISQPTSTFYFFCMSCTESSMKVYMFHRLIWVFFYRFLLMFLHTISYTTSIIQASLYAHYSKLIPSCVQPPICKWTGQKENIWALIRVLGIDVSCIHRPHPCLCAQI